MSPRIDHLTRLLGDGFPRGWSGGRGAGEQRLDELLAEAPEDLKRGAASEIESLLAGGLCEAQVRDVLLYEIGCWYAPEVDGLEASSWLAHVGVRLRGTSTEPDPEPADPAVTWKDGLRQEPHP